jgi:maleylpyruvate isomerase
MTDLVFHEYWRSGAAWRVRMALALKGVAVTSVSHDLSAGEQRTAAYLALNPQGLVPAISVDGAVIAQSLAILEWLEEVYPTPALLPDAPLARARVRALCGVIACDIHPLQNLRVQKWVKKQGLDPMVWNQHWIGEGLAALETLVTQPDGGSGTFCHGDTPTMAECLLLPQLYAARRFEVDTSAYSALSAIEARALAVPAIADSHPDRQPH